MPEELEKIIFDFQGMVGALKIILGMIGGYGHASTGKIKWVCLGIFYGFFASVIILYVLLKVFQ